MSHGRHRLFDAKLRDGWHTYMQGTELTSQWRGQVPIYANGYRIPNAWITTIIIAKSCGSGDSPTLSFRSA